MGLHFAWELCGKIEGFRLDDYLEMNAVASLRKKSEESALSSPNPAAQAASNRCWEEFQQMARSYGLTPVCTGLKPHVTIGDPDGPGYYFGAHGPLVQDIQHHQEVWGK